MFVPSISTLTHAALLVLGIVWCVQMLPRWRADLHTLGTTKDWSERGAVLVLWTLTAVALALCLRFGYGVARNIVRGIRDLV